MVKPKYAVKTNQISNPKKALFLFAIVLFGSFLHFRSYRKVVSSVATVSAIESDAKEVVDSISNNEKESDGAAADELTDEEIFFQTANSLTPVTDKVGPHSYQTMYGQFLLPFYKRKPNMKILEIGLGCHMSYGPGASVALWKKLIPEAELWEGEFNVACAEDAKEKGKLDGIHIVYGDQGDVTVLDRWIEETGGGEFDVVVDDGSHQNCHIWTTFLKFWPLLKPGGLYFLEDLQVGRTEQYSAVDTQLCTKDNFVVADKMKSFLERLTIESGRQNDKDIEGIKDVKFIFCQKEACVLGKDEERSLSSTS